MCHRALATASVLHRARASPMTALLMQRRDEWCGREWQKSGNSRVPRGVWWAPRCHQTSRRAPSAGTVGALKSGRDQESPVRDLIEPATDGSRTHQLADIVSYRARNHTAAADLQRVDESM